MSKNLKDIYTEKGKIIMDDLLNSKRVTIYEKLDGINFGFIYENGEFSFFKKNPKSPIGSIDRVLTTTYDEPIKYINELDKDIFYGADNYIFSFDYFPNTNPSTINYDSQPKNNLILNYIDDGTGNKIVDKSLLDTWADKLGVGRCPIIFDGKFSLEQIEQIFKYLNHSKEEVETKLQNVTFTEWLYSIINPDLNRTTLNDTLKSQIDSLFFRFENEKGDVYFGNIKNPFIEELLSRDKQKDIDHNYYLILSDIVDYLLKIDISKIKLTKKTFEERYVELVSKLFNKYMKLKKDDYVNMIIDLPDYLKKDFNRLNINLIKDRETLELINFSKNNQDVFRVFLSSFRKKRKYTNFIFSEAVNNYFNGIVDKIIDLCSYNRGEDERLVEAFITFKEFERIYIDDEDSVDVIGVDLDAVLRKQPEIVVDFVETDFNSDKFISSIFVETEKKKRRRDNRIAVNLIIDTFTPFTKTLDEFAEYSFNEDGIPFVLISVKNQGAIFTPEIQESIFKILKDKNNQYVDYLFVNRPNIRKIINSLSDLYRVNKIYSNSRFMKLIDVQLVDNYRCNNYLDLVETDNEIAEYFKSDESIYNEVMQSLYNSDFTTFKKYCIDEYSNVFNEFLRKYNGY